MGFLKPKVAPLPEPVEVKQAAINPAVADRQASDILRRRKGRAATVTGAGETGTTAGAVASKSLLGQ